MTLANRPGLSALAYRAGTYATFFETMVARLSSLGIELPTGKYDEHGQAITASIFPLTALTTRDPSDLAIALLDAWAVVADVLTFYDERLANEGYLRTATERRSVLELAGLVGYALRPGVASTAYLAYTIDEDRSVTPPKGMEVTILAGTRAQSVPEPGQLPQPFEIAEDLPARTVWNKLGPRLSQPQTVASIKANGLYLKGTATNLKPNDAILIDFGLKSKEITPLRVVEVEADTAADRTHVTLRPWLNTKQAFAAVFAIVNWYQEIGVPAQVKDAGALLDKFKDLGKKAPTVLADFLEKEVIPALSDLYIKLESKLPEKAKTWLRDLLEELDAASTQLRNSIASESGIGLARKEFEVKDLLSSLKVAPSIPPRNAVSLEKRSLQTAFQPGADVFPRALATFRPSLGPVLGSALANATVAPPEGIKVYAFRVSASLFGHNTPDQPKFKEDGTVDHFVNPTLSNTWGESVREIDNGYPTIALDAEYGEIKSKSWVIIERPRLLLFGNDKRLVTLPEGFTSKLTIHSAESVGAATMAALGVSTKVTFVGVSIPWMSEAPQLATLASESTPLLRQTRVFAQSELLELAEAPLTAPICQAEIELDDYYDGLEAGRWVIVQGERAEVFDVNNKEVDGIISTELAMILSVSHRVATAGPNEKSPPLPDDKTHTFITLSTDPAYCYVREKMAIYANVVKATHGETRKETLGSGDASKPMQELTLRQSPLTFLPAPTAEGAASTLVVRVNEVEWHETDTLAGLAPDDRKFITRTDDESKTKVVFGNGREGARPPTGRENITAVYRNGIGRPGNVKAGQINQLATRPLGVKEVINPLPATGGANREGRDQARKNAPLGILSLARLVSLQDYADFTRTFAGISKASAVKLSDGARELIYVTIAGADDIPIDRNSDLYQNLLRALRSLGDPHLPVRVELREMLSLVMSANVRVLPDYAWEFVEPKIRAALIEAFSFEQRELAQDVTKSEVISVVQGVRGVAYVDLDFLATISESDVEAELRRTTLNAGKGSAEDNTPESKTFAEALVTVDHRVVVQPARVNAKATTFSERLVPAQIAVLSTALPETLILTEVKE
jgi:hypothetical protein